MQWKALLALVACASSAHALLRFGCSQLVIERFDPLLNPGVVSPHLHQIIGGNAFNITMDPKADLFATSTCTTCRFKEDTSNYWTAALYYKHTNGSFHRVPQMANQFVGSTNGGMTVYYIQPFDGQKVTAPPRGFRMIVGDAMTRSMNQSNADAQAITFRCFSANFGDSTAAPGLGSDTHNLPTKTCDGGIRANIYFPMCWDGKTLDPPDHKSHVAFPTGAQDGAGMFGWGGKCPASHPVRLPQLFTETVFDTRQFNSMWQRGSPNPFVFSMGDPDGYGHHADYVFGWQGDSLQRAMDKCTDISGGACNQLTQLTDAEINACTQARRVDEPVDGWLKALPGCNPVQGGPGRATPQDGCGATTEYTPGGPAGPAPAGEGSTPAVSPPSGGGSQGGGGVTPPVTGGTPPATGGGGATVAHYGQCGGNGYTGATTCAAPYTCKKQNDWYSQCL